MPFIATAPELGSPDSHSAKHPHKMGNTTPTTSPKNDPSRNQKLLLSSLQSHFIILYHHPDSTDKCAITTPQPPRPQCSDKPVLQQRRQNMLQSILCFYPDCDTERAVRADNPFPLKSRQAYSRRYSLQKPDRSLWPRHR